MGNQRAIFLDRDGTLNEEVGHLRRTEDLRIYPEALEAVRKINQSGALTIVITNQSAIARGFLDEEELGDLHGFLQEEFRREGARIDGFYYCPHHPDAGTGAYTQECTCRKPQPGMLIRAARELHLEIATSFMIGDKLDEVEAGHRAGCRSVLLKTGYGEGELRVLDQGEFSAPFEEVSLRRPVHVAENVLKAVDWIMEQTFERPSGITD
ncbi:MAG: HAD family hydrolase [Acidobacteriota bacterium]|nr:HAD family hydrolase [Acidobacteriota bacterium]